MARRSKPASKSRSKSSPRPLPGPAPDGAAAMLVNQLSIRDARHMVRMEGGTMTPGAAASRLVSTLVVSAFVARAIVVGKATAWHLFLPMLGEYLALLVSLPVVNLVLKDDLVRKNARNSFCVLVGYTLGAAGWIAFTAHRQGHGWSEQANLEFVRLSAWIVGHEMHWPILGAAVGFLFGIPGRVRCFREHGPPFCPVGLGCGMRFVVLMFGCFVIPWVLGDARRIVWAVWAVLLFAELGALVMHWDLQRRRLRKRGIEI